MEVARAAPSFWLLASGYFLEQQRVDTMRVEPPRALVVFMQPLDVMIEIHNDPIADAAGRRAMAGASRFPTARPRRTRGLKP